MPLIYTAPTGQPQTVQLITQGQENRLAQLVDSASPSLGIGAPLSNVRFVDAGTTVPLAARNGSIVAPFSTVQAAVNSLPVGGAIFICPGVYAEAVATAVNIHFVGLTGGRLTPAVTITSITASGAAALSIDRCIVPTVATGTGALTFANGSSTTVTLGGSLSAQNATIGTLTCTFISAALFTQFTSPITLTGAASTSAIRASCNFASAAADITGAGGTSSILWDPDSYSTFIGANNVIVGVPNVRVRARLGSAIVALAIPALIAGQTGEAAVSLVGTELEGILTSQAVHVCPPIAALAPGVGVGVGGLLSGRITATSTLTCTFLGALTGGATAGFLVAKLT